MQLVTGYTGVKHVSAQDDSIRNVMLGEFNGRGVFPILEEFDATAVTANEVRVRSGYGINQGRLFKIDRNDYDSCTIENGAAGYKRVDLIVARYLKDEQTGIESCELVVIKGTPSTEGYVDPSYTSGNLLTGALQDDMPMYRVKINGVAIEAVEQMFEKYESLIGGIDKRIYAMTEEQFDDKLGENQQRFEDWFASVQAYLDEDTAMKLTNAVASHNAAFGAFNNNIADDEGNVSGLGVLPFTHGGTGKTSESAFKTYICDMLYPVGSIYMSVDSENPSSKFGGTWVAWGSGQVPVGVNANDTDFATVEKTGGAKSHSYTPAGTVGNHTLTIAEMPKHSHTTYYLDEGFALASGNIHGLSKNTDTGNEGGGQPHNHPFTGTASTQSHLQPYITCYMWKRTA
jgi:hypothetical protein